MPTSAIIIDIDNTIIDTAIRKRNILVKMFRKDVSLLDIRNDYSLENTLGRKGSEQHIFFFSTLSSDEGILDFPAPAFDKSIQTINNMYDRNIKIILLSARPINLHDSTVKELKNTGLSKKKYELFLASNTQPEKTINPGYKRMILECLLQKYDIIASISDRPEDIILANSFYIPGILFNSTLSDDERKNIQNSLPDGAITCDNWSEIEITIEQLLKSREYFERQREVFSEQYSSWLSDIDAKANTTATIAGILSALSGSWLISNFDGLFDYVLILSLLISVVSLIYSIRAITPRYTSGSSSAKTVKPGFIQYISILIGCPKKWQNIPGDAIDENTSLSKENDVMKAREHIAFFYKRYHTYNPEVIKNLRLFELRASNYSKLYAETIASNLLILAILLGIVWFFGSFFFA